MQVRTTVMETDQPTSDTLTRLLGRMLIASGSTFFLAFYFAFAMLHVYNSNNMWLPAGVTHPNAGLGLAALLLILAAGLIYLWGKQRLYAGATAVFAGGAGATFALVFVAAICYALSLAHMGFSVRAGGYADIFFGLTLMFLLALIAVLIGLAGVANRARLGLYGAERRAAPDAYGEVLAWFVVIAALNWFLLYVLPFLNLES